MEETPSSNLRFSKETPSSTEAPPLIFSRRKKKKPLVSTVENETSSDDYAYDWLLARVYAQLGTTVTSSKKSLPIPSLGRLGSRKTVWDNFEITCKVLQRDPVQIKDFFFRETKAPVSLNQKGSLVIRGRFSSLDLEKILRIYITLYVTCDVCRCGETFLEKTNRILFKHCVSCGEKSAVAQHLL